MKFLTMINGQVQVSKVETLSDGSIQLKIVLLNGTADDFMQAFLMKNTETSMILTPSEQLVSTIQQVGSTFL
jgi:hypothetical protein